MFVSTIQQEKKSQPTVEFKFRSITNALVVCGDCCKMALHVLLKLLWFRSNISAVDIFACLLCCKIVIFEGIGCFGGFYQGFGMKFLLGICRVQSALCCGIASWY